MVVMILKSDFGGELSHNGGISKSPNFDVLTSVLREKSGERADFEHAALVPRRVELIDLPVIYVGILVPWLRLVVLPLVLLLLPLEPRLSFSSSIFDLHG